MKFKIFALVLPALLLAACASSQKASVYQPEQAQTQMRVVYGTVLEVRNVEIEARPSGVGTAAGAVAGGIGGSHLGSGSGNVVGGIAGAVVGGVLGSTIEREAMKKQAVEIVYRRDGSAESYALVQEKDENNTIMVGDRIRLMDNYSTLRAVKVQ